MIREIIRPQTQSYIIEIPKEYLNREVEILVFPLSSTKLHSDQRDNIITKTSGILSGKKIDPVIWQRQIRSEWDNRE